MLDNRKVVFSGVQPSGNLTIGNYLGAIKNFSAFQEDTLRLFCVVDLHAITVRQVPQELRRRTYETLALYIAAGLDPQKCVLFVQSQVPAHAELGWILDCYTMFGELSRMTQFKDKSAKHADNINAGLFTYPVLMAGDILLYQTDLVPVGADQKQHIELARDIAIRFNNAYGETFKVPEGFIPKFGGRVMSLSDPTMKMSKSDPNPNGYVAIMDDPAIIMKKFKRAVTDSDTFIAFDPQNKPGVSNLLSIYTSFTGTTMDEAVAHFDGLGYGSLKTEVAEAVISGLEPVQAEYKRILADKEYLEKVMKEGAEKATAQAMRTLRKVYRRVGLS